MESATLLGRRRDDGEDASIGRAGDALLLRDYANVIVNVSSPPSHPKDWSGLWNGAPPPRTAQEFFTMLDSPTVAARRNETSSSPFILLVWHNGGIGGLCNRLQEILHAVDLVAAMPGTIPLLFLAFDEEITKKLPGVLDTDFLRHRASRLEHFSVESLLRRSSSPGTPPIVQLRNVHVMLSWSRKDFVRAASDDYGHAVVGMELRPIALVYEGQSDYSFATVLAARPPQLLNEVALQQTRKFRASMAAARPELTSAVNGEGGSLSLVSLHKRNFGIAYCKRLNPFCSGRRRSVYSTFPEECNLTYTPKLMESLRQQWKRIPELANAIGFPSGGGDVSNVTRMSEANASSFFAFMLASDLADPQGDASFLEWSGVATWLIQHSGMVGGGFWDPYMMIDLIAQVQARFSVGNPWSSCDRILAHWKSTLWEVNVMQGMKNGDGEDEKETKSDENPFPEVARQYRFKKDNVPGSRLNRMHPPECYAGYHDPFEQVHIDKNVDVRRAEFAFVDGWRYWRTSLVKAVASGGKSSPVREFGAGSIRKFVVSNTALMRMPEGNFTEWVYLNRDTVV